MVKQWTVQYPAFTGIEPRKVYVYLPAGYKKAVDTRYPVLYAFDGQNLFWDRDATYGKSWGLKDFLDQKRIPIIVASIECNHSAENGRLAEYSPFDSENPDEPFEGHGEETMDWFINEFKSFIDEHFRTIPDREHTFIMGSSMGGLMSLYAAIAHNDVFSRAIALSPTLDVDIDSLVYITQKSNMDLDTVIYMDYGEKEFEYEPWSWENFSRMTSALLKKQILLNTRIVPNGEHTEASWQKQLPYCINTLLYEV